MIKYLRYEFKETYKYNFITLLSMIVFNAFMLQNISNCSISEMTSVTFIEVVNLSIILFVVAHLIFLYKEELYGERGYLTFSLPVKNSSIFSAKIVVTIVWVLIHMSIIILFGSAFIRKLSVNTNMGILYLADLVVGKNITVGFLELLSILFQIVIAIVAIYFSITISKFISSNRKLTLVVSYIILVGMLVGYLYINLKLVELIPMGVYLNNLHIGRGIIGAFIATTKNGAYFSFISTLYNLFMLIVMYITTGYILNRQSIF